MASSEKLNMALLGLGRAGKFHIQSIQSIPGINLRCVVDVDESLAKHLAKDLECDYSTDAEGPLGQADIDAVIVASPTHEHYGQIQAALKAGKPVFTEKPLGSSLKEIDTCFGLAKRSRLPLFVGFNRRFDPSFSSLARGVKEGQVGVLQMLRVTSRDSPLPTMDYISTSHGIFHDCIVHDFDMLRFITDKDPVEIYSAGSSFVEGIGALGDLDNVLVVLRYDNGMIASIDVNRFASYGYDQRIEAFGSKGMLQAENRSPVSTVLSSDEGLLRPTIEHSFPTRYREAYRQELTAFSNCLREGEPVPVTHKDVRMSFILSELGEQSHREARPLRVSEHPAFDDLQEEVPEA
ncbi:MAG: Gfo/Idh/MocA family oxidoreductase [Verrucomicrobiota bacterium]|jgi:myo-inositol 2-dehydrogenase/D-chiro-inositol 1-dehydrogenase|nr:Gfo/Idh/MocA family oxidoreductase [Verrucomicrobiota bacterium]MDP7050728.1 Gfo/Idh/MocA family oxidoreductase [Verrucomicrobiota bacterium]